MTVAIKVLSEQKNAKPSRHMPLIETTIKLLCQVCTVKTSRFYIPGETNIAERLRKRAFDSGLFSVLTQIYKELSRSVQQS